MCLKVTHNLAAVIYFRNGFRINYFFFLYSVHSVSKIDARGFRSCECCTLAALRMPAPMHARSVRFVYVCMQIDARINQMLTFLVQSENVIRSSNHFDLESSVVFAPKFKLELRWQHRWSKPGNSDQVEKGISHRFSSNQKIWRQTKILHWYLWLQLMPWIFSCVRSTQSFHSSIEWLDSYF